MSVPHLERAECGLMTAPPLSEIARPASEPHQLDLRSI
jgi:hypothetical protein